MNNNKILWDNIDWKRVEKRINKIQERIYNASKNGKTSTVRFLQDCVINSLDAKLLAVRRVTTSSSGRKTPGIDKTIYVTSIEKMQLVKSLSVDGFAVPIRRVWIPKPGKVEKRPLGIPIIRDRAKQKLVLLALEPAWEAKFEPNSYGFRPGRSCQDAMESVFQHIRIQQGKKPKYILEADLKGCFDNIDHQYLLDKLEASPQITLQIKAWLKAGIFEGMSLAPDLYGQVPSNDIGTPQGGVISPFLCNVALHGMENFLKDWIKTQNWPTDKVHHTYTANKIKSIGIVRYADDFVVIHSNKDIVVKAHDALAEWLSNTSKLTFNSTKTSIHSVAQTSHFLGFSFLNVIRCGKYRAKIYPSIKNQKNLIAKISERCKKFRAISSFELIKSLRPILIGWANYFRYCECKSVFSDLDNRIFSILRSWVFRRDKRHGRRIVKENYFPSGKVYSFDNRTYHNNWVLCGKTKAKDSGIITENFLPKLAWVSSNKFVKVKLDASVYDGNTVYWSLRTKKYGGFNTRQRLLLKRQNGLCSYCSGPIMDKDVQVDHIVPIGKGGRDIYANLQLLHNHCHIRKTADDLTLYSEVSKGSSPAIKDKKGKK